MRLLVCVKQVPDTNEVKIDSKRGTLIREGVPSILNTDDSFALEAALTIKDKHPETTVTVISMGPPQAQIMLRECLAMGADNAVLLSSRAFGGADTCATSQTLAAGIRKLGGFDLIFAGRQAIDGDTAQVGPQLAVKLGLPLVCYVCSVEENSTGWQVRRQMEDGMEQLEISLPSVLTCVKELGTPRYMTVKGIVEAYEKQIVVWNETDIGLDPAECGLKASPTQVLRSFAPPEREKGTMLHGTVKETSIELAKLLIDRHLA